MSEEIIIASIDVLKDFVSDMAVEIQKLSIPTWETAENNDTVKQNTGS